MEVKEADERSVLYLEKGLSCISEVLQCQQKCPCSKCGNRLACVNLSVYCKSSDTTDNIFFDFELRVDIGHDTERCIKMTKRK